MRTWRQNMNEHAKFICTNTIEQKRFSNCAQQQFWMSSLQLCDFRLDFLNARSNDVRNLQKRDPPGIRTGVKIFPRVA